MDRSDYQVISQCNTLKRSILLCIHDEVRPLENVRVLLVCFAGIAFSSLETWPVSELKVASGKPKRKHSSKQISQEQEEKENSKKYRPFKQMPPRRAPVFLLSPGINTRGRLCRHVEFSPCHVVWYRPIRHFSPVKFLAANTILLMRK